MLRTALNNLAWFLAQRDPKSAGEALKLINRAIDELAGPLPHLLDTRALVYLALRRYHEALQDLFLAVGEVQTAARFYHLAQAYRLARKRPEAKEAFEVAKVMGLDASSLHALERPMYKQVLADLGK